MSPWRLRQLVRDGALRRPLREVYVDATLDDSIELRARSAALVVSKSAVVTDRSAAWLWGVDALRPVDLDVPPPLEKATLNRYARFVARKLMMDMTQSWTSTEAPTTRPPAAAPAPERPATPPGPDTK